MWEFGSAAVLKYATVTLKVDTEFDLGYLGTVDYIHEYVPDLAMPRTLGVLQAGKRTFHFMIPGLCSNRVSKVCPLRENIQTQLDTILCALRAVPPPPLENGRQAFGGGVPCRCKDVRRIERVADFQIENEQELVPRVMGESVTACVDSHDAIIHVRHDAWRPTSAKYHCKRCAQRGKHG